MRGSKAVTAATVVALSLTASACGGSQQAGAGSGTLTYAVVGVPPSLAAAASGLGSTSPFTQAVYDSLLSQSPDGEVQPSLASSWSYNSDKTVLTMKLREGVKFTDGTAFDASVAAKNLQHSQKGPAAAGGLASMKEAKAQNPGTLVITLAQPDPAFLLSLAQAAGAMQSPKQFGTKAEKTDPIGTGPYVFDATHTVAGSKYVYTKNPDYWNQDAQHYDKVVLSVLGTVSTQTNAAMGKQLNVVTLLTPDTEGKVKAAGYQLLPQPSGWTGLLLLDRDGKLSPPLAKVKVRQAINYAIDRKALLKAPGGDRATPTNQIFGPKSPAYVADLDDAYPYDPAKAKQLLREAGYPKGFTLKMPQMQAGSNVASNLAKQNLGDVGIKVEYASETIQSAYQKMLAGQYPALVFGITSDLNLWRAVSSTVVPTSLLNPFHTKNAQVDALLSKIQTGSDGEAAAAGKQLNRYLVEQAWFVPFTRGSAVMAVDQNTSAKPQADSALPLLQYIEPKE
ncbi:ABC transporter substrate-binding protein [Streptomyces sp. NPDC013978]|uniref:ABC transporter substrate-binding protein n=1 Tax=Streptomyces sp. NPDC013978 TaxID=3364869 RepID=UPI0036FDB4D9